MQTAHSFYKKLRMAHEYHPTGTKINAKTFLFKPTENYSKLDNDYGLATVSIYHFLFFHKIIEKTNQLIKLQFCTEKVEIQTVKGDHRTILTGDSVQQIAQVVQAQL